MSHEETLPFGPPEDQPPMGASDVEAPAEPEVAKPPLSIAERNGGYDSRPNDVYQDTVGQVPPGTYFDDSYTEQDPRVLETKAALHIPQAEKDLGKAHIAAVKRGEFASAPADFVPVPRPEPAERLPVGDSYVSIDQSHRALAATQEVQPPAGPEEDLLIEGRVLKDVPRRIDNNEPSRIIRRSDR